MKYRFFSLNHLVGVVQRVLPVTRSEIIGVCVIGGACLGVLLHHLILNPSDPFSSQLQKRMKFVVDSITTVQDSIRHRKNTMDSLRRVHFPELARKESLAVAINDSLQALGLLSESSGGFVATKESGQNADESSKQRGFQPTSEYKKKELPTKPININSAGIEELTKLPGVGEKMAEKIVAYRKQQRFSAPEEIMDVPGIGEKKFEKMKMYIRIR